MADFAAGRRQKDLHRVAEVCFELRRSIRHRAQRLQLAALRREAKPPQPGDALLVDALASGVPIPRPRQRVNILCNGPSGLRPGRGAQSTNLCRSFGTRDGHETRDEADA